METDFLKNQLIEEENMRKFLSLLLVCGLATLCLAGCASKTSSLAEQMFSFDGADDYYKNVEEHYTLNYDEMIYDDFTQGIDKDRWVIGDSVWDQWGTDQNGVRPQNVFLLDDSDSEAHLLLRANGEFYSGAPLSSQIDGYKTGAAISTVEALGPGRYEIRMKPMPRLGALTSMWLFSWFEQNDGSVQQNEIDIEIGIQPNFDLVSFTTWTSPDTNTNRNVEMDYMVNDGNWHTYSFDWVTDAEIPYVDYFVDGKLVYTSTANVPTTNATLSIGIWVPCWAGGGEADSNNISNGSRMFDSDYAEISWFRYIPFSMGNWEQRPVTNRPSDATFEPTLLTKMPVVNKAANGDFEQPDESYEHGDGVTTQYVYPWMEYMTDTEDTAAIVQDPDNSANHVAQVNGDQLFGQWLRGSGNGYTYRLTGRYKATNGASAQFSYSRVIGYATTSGSAGMVQLPIGDSTTWTEFDITFTVNNRDESSLTKSIRYYLDNGTDTGTVYFDDISLVYLDLNAA